MIRSFNVFLKRTILSFFPSSVSVSGLKIRSRDYMIFISLTRKLSRNFLVQYTFFFSAEKLNLLQTCSEVPIALLGRIPVNLEVSIYHNIGIYDIDDMNMLIYAYRHFG